MMAILLSFLATLVIIFVIPIVVYGLFAAYLGLKEPDKKLGFLVSVLVQKIGHAFGFVFLFYVSRHYFIDKWLLYAMIWLIMFALVEIGQAIGQNYSRKEAVAGIISEIIYFPLAAFIVHSIL